MGLTDFYFIPAADDGGAAGLVIHPWVSMKCGFLSSLL